MRKVHKYVDEQHTRIREDSQRAKYRELGSGGHLSVGDYCFVKKAPEPGISVRFQSPTFPGVFQVVESHGEGQDAKAYTVSDLSGVRENLGFTQPLALDRLIPCELLPLAQVSDDSKTRISISEGPVERLATITAQSADGKVHIVYDDNPDEVLRVDLSHLKYRWT